MTKSKNTQLFCLTSYKKWLAVLCFMIVGLSVWIVVGFDKNKTRVNMNRLAEKSHALEEGLGRGHDGFFDPMHMARLQESYSDVAGKVREVTVNISATQRIGGAGGNGLAFVDPFDATSPGRMVRQQVPQLSPSIVGGNAVAPPITPDATMPHAFRGVCSNCHVVTKKLAANAVAAPPQGRKSVGSGVIIDPSGYILSNYHIIANANDVMVTTGNGNKYRAEITYTDVVGDLVILKINSPTLLPSAIMGDSDMVQEGDIVLAVGNPFGLNQSVTAGIISNTNVSAPIGGKPFSGLIQTDAAINRGSSGGPLVNIKGEVIGINTAIYSMSGDFTGIGFAIPINRAKETFVSVPTLNAIAANVIDLNVGEIVMVAMQADTPEAWFGVEVSAIDPIMAEQFGLHTTSGVLVNKVFADSPAAFSGLKRGDVIEKINGRKVANTLKFQKITSLLLPGNTVAMTLTRNNKPVSLTATLENRANVVVQQKTKRVAAAGPAEMEWAGMEVVPITPVLAKKYGIRKGTHGVLAIEVEGMATAVGIMRGDVIKGINRSRVGSMADFVNATANASVPDGVLFDISRQGDPLFITM